MLDSKDKEAIKTMGGRVDGKTHRLMRTASVYSIYHVGADELQKRFVSSGKNAKKLLSAQSIQAIRASLDGGW